MFGGKFLCSGLGLSGEKGKPDGAGIRAGTHLAQSTHLSRHLFVLFVQETSDSIMFQTLET